MLPVSGRLRFVQDPGGMLLDSNPRDRNVSGQ